MRMTSRSTGDSGTVAVLYAIVFGIVIVPLIALGTSTYVRTTTDGELERAADSGALAAAAAIPFGNLQFATDYVNATSGGATTQTLADLGLTYPLPDPLQVACDQASRSATDTRNVAATYALPNGGVQCDQPTYLPDPLSSTIDNCATALGLLPPPLPGQPDFRFLVPALLRPGVEVHLSWRVSSPTDQVFGRDATTTQSADAVARRRYKDMVVIPVTTLPATGTFNLDPLSTDVRTTVSAAIDGTRQLLMATPSLAPCATLLDATRDDILDAVDPPATGPQFNAVLASAAASQTPVLVVPVVESLGVPYLDFLPVCVEDSGVADASGSSYVAHVDTFGECSVVSPGAFRASLRRPT